MPVTLGPGPHTRETLEAFYRASDDRPWGRGDEEYNRDPVHRTRLDFLRDAVSAFAPSVLLDVGCGTGVFLRRDGIAQIPFRIGCDLAENNFNRNADPAIRFVAADAAALPFRDAAIPCIVCSETLEHLADPAPALAELRRILLPGGRLFVTVPNFFCLDSVEGRLKLLERAGKLLGRDLSINTHLVMEFPGEWKTRFESAGFRVMRDAPIYPVPYVPYFMRRAKQLEAALFATPRARRALETWSRAVAEIPLLRLTGQIHFFECEKA